jgi:hypothetical protein
MVDVDQIINTCNTSFVDKYVTLQFFKEKKTTRTYIIGLDGFMKSEEVKSFVNDTKKKLGTAMLEKQDDIFGTMYGFNGDHETRIREMLIASKIPEEKIKISNS